jgi:hypothetical protein
MASTASVAPSAKRTERRAERTNELRRARQAQKPAMAKEARGPNGNAAFLRSLPPQRPLKRKYRRGRESINAPLATGQMPWIAWITET